jgi:redox-sensitive bicupin YhaK (pirin superfamily)
VIEGEIHHRDSRGNDQIAKKGELQWMHAGAGIIHSERPSQDLVATQGKQEIIQLWINTPAEKKMTPPSYQYIPEKEIPVFQSVDGLINNKLITGKMDGLQGKIKPESDLKVLWCTAKSGGTQSYAIDNTHNSMVYLISGDIRVKGFGLVNAKNLIVFEDEGSEISITAEEDARFLVLSGKPIEEKTVQRGPFVMNSMTEIMEAMRDYQMGKMGILIEE